MKIRLIIGLCLFAFFSCKEKKENFLNQSWTLQKSDKECKLNYIKLNENHFVLDYHLYKENEINEGNPNKWVSIKSKIENLSSLKKSPLVLRIKSESNDFLELKFIDINGSVFGTKLELKDNYKKYSNITIYLKNIEYMWGGKDDIMDELEYLEIVLSGKGRGKIYLEAISFDASNPKSKLPILVPVLDSLDNKKGFGFWERRDSILKPEDPLILEWLKDIQDYSSNEKKLLPSQEDNEVSTFNNALVAMAFIVKNEKERAERILDYYKNARSKENNNIDLQNFYYKGEARGFYQYSSLKNKELNKEIYQMRNSDRWMGDNVWLTIAFLHHQKKFKSTKYDSTIQDLKELLISWYIDSENSGGYLRHGWRKNDTKLHENSGHEEGNIDAYAMFKLMGEDYYAKKIKQWLDFKLKGRNLPLDLYTWRTLAYGKEYASLLDIPDFDLRYRKIVNVKGSPAMGFYHGPNININNIWLDGTGHIACAYISCGDKYRGYFYANQLDKFIIERKIQNRITHAIPYTLNKKGGYKWVDQSKGFASVAAWYIFTKNKFNPLKLIYVD